MATGLERGAAVRVRAADPAERERWDDLLPSWPNHRVVHSRAWLESLRASGCGEPLYLVFEKDGELVGGLPGLLTSVAGWRLFGSPLAGWQTVSLGPAFDPDRTTTAELLAPLVPFLEREHRVDLIEMLHPSLDPDAMTALGFRGRTVPTYRAPLIPGDAARTFDQLHDSARRNVRRAERLGLIARVEEDEGFVDEHYAQLREVYVRGGHTIPFDQRRVLECFRHMRDAGRLLATAVYLPDGRTCVATGMFFMDGHELLLWGWAHRPHYRWYRATELMTWLAMQRALAAGCEVFDLMGLGEFKEKFGATLDEAKVRWVRARHGWLANARDAAEVCYRLQQAVRGRALRLTRRAGAEHRNGSRPARSAAACVLGDVDLVRALGLAGVTCDVVAPPGDAARYSRSVGTRLPWFDAWEHPDDLTDALVRYGLAQPEPPILFYADDAGLLLVSRQRDRLKQAFRFVVPDADLVEQLVDKGRFQSLAQRLKLPVPAARTARPWAEPPDALIAFGLPLMVKPLTRRPEQWGAVAGEAKAIRVETADALRALWPRLVAGRLEVVAQQPVPGSETRIESYHAYVDAKGHVVGEFTGRKIRTRPAEYGDSTALEITNQADVAALGRALMKRLNLRGVAKLDFKRGPDGTLHLLEVNPRFTLWSHPGAAAGVNLPALVYGDLVGWPRAPAVRARAGVRWCRPWADIGAARAAGVPLARWVSWALACEAKRAIAWDDPLPIIGAALARLAHRRAGSERGSP